MAELIFFILFALGVVVGSIGVLTARNPVNSAISMVVAFFFLSGIYVLLNAQFMAIIQILVYAGAIMVLFLFVLMLLNIRDDEIEDARLNIHQVVAVVAGAAVLLVLVQAVTAFVGADARLYSESLPAGYGTVDPIGVELITRFVLPFELAAVLLLVGIVSAVVVAKKRL